METPQNRTLRVRGSAASGAVQHQLAFARVARATVDWELCGTPPVVLIARKANPNRLRRVAE